MSFGPKNEEEADATQQKLDAVIQRQAAEVQHHKMSCYREVRCSCGASFSALRAEKLREDVEFLLAEVLRLRA